MSRISRLEFSKPVRLEIFRRAGGPGDLRCEGCGLSLQNKAWEVDHVIEEWEMEDVEHGLRAPLTAADGKLLGKYCCHVPKTAKKAKERAHGKRIVAKAARCASKSRPIPGSRASGLRRRMNGNVERW
jgi:hypothetical protein